MSFLKKLVKKGTNIDPMDEKLKEKIERLVVGMLDNYKSNYHERYKEVTDQWTTEGKEFTHDDVDREAYNRAGGDSLKDTISNKVWDEVEDDVETNIKTKTTNQLVITGSKKVAEKTVEVMVHKSIDEGIKQISSKKDA